MGENITGKVRHAGFSEIGLLNRVLMMKGHFTIQERQIVVPLAVNIGNSLQHRFRKAE